MTKAQAQTLSFIRRFVARNGFSPSLDEIKDALGVKSKSHVHRIVTELVERGYLCREKGFARSLVLTTETEYHRGYVEGYRAALKVLGHSLPLSSLVNSQSPIGAEPPSAPVPAIELRHPIANSRGVKFSDVAR